MRGDGGVAGEGRVFGVPKFHSWGKCTMTLIKLHLGVTCNLQARLIYNANLCSQEIKCKTTQDL